MEKTEMMKHTKEPWFAEKTLQGRDSSVSDMSGNTIAIAYKNTNISGDDLANARRIVACVNGCEDIPDEELDRFFKWARGMWFRQEKLIKEEREKLAKMNDKEKVAYEARREATLDYNLRSLRRAYDRVDETV